MTKMGAKSGKGNMHTSTRHLGGLLDTYLRKKLSRNIHPAITLIRDHGEATSPFSRPPRELEPQATSSNALDLVARPQGDVVPVTPGPRHDDTESEIDLYAGQLSASLLDS